MPGVWFGPGAGISSLSTCITWALGPNQSGSKMAELDDDRANFHLLHRYDTYNTWSFTFLRRLQGVVFLGQPLHNKGLGISILLTTPRDGWGFSREDQGRGTTLGPIIICSSSSESVSKPRVISPTRNAKLRIIHTIANGTAQHTRLKSFY